MIQDNCPPIPNQGQQDSNDNNVGDACDDEIVVTEDDLTVHPEVEDVPSQDQGDDEEGGNGESDVGQDTTSPDEQEPEPEEEGGG
jgi:syndecan 4